MLLLSYKPVESHILQQSVCTSVLHSLSAVLGAKRGMCTRVQELKELIASYQTLREGGRGPAICSTIIETARQCNLDKDVSLPGEEDDCKELPLEERDSIVGKVYSK